MQKGISDELILFNTMMMVAKERGEILRLSSELNNIIEKAIELEKNSSPVADSTITTSSALIRFTEKEIEKMPKEFKKTFKLNGCVAHVRKRNDGRYNCSYEIRYARKPYNNPPVSASGRTLEEAKANFVKKLHEYIPSESSAIAPAIPKDFDGFAMYWFENFHKRKVCERTYDHDIKLYNRHIKKRFGKLKVKDVNAVMLQDFLDNAPGTGKTAKDLFSILNQILNCAVKHGLINLNPLGMCFLNSYEQEHGTLITKDEERKLSEAYKGTEWELPFAVVRYTGLRPNEYTTATICGKFIKAVNSKRHNNGKVEYKYIPITPMLRPFLQGVTELVMPKERVLNNRFKKVLPTHKLYDMRTTFQTRCSECGIPDNVIGVWMGNSIGKLKEAYTDFSEEYLLKEAKKFFY